MVLKNICAPKTTSLMVWFANYLRYTYGKNPVSNILLIKQVMDLINRLTAGNHWSLSLCSYSVSHPTLCHPMDCSPPVYSGLQSKFYGKFHRIFQARVLEWVAISYSRGSSWPRDRIHISCVSCIGRQILLPLSHMTSPKSFLGIGKLQIYKNERHQLFS